MSLVLFQSKHTNKNIYEVTSVIYVLLLLLLLTALELSLGGSSPYTSTDKRNNTEHSKYQYTYYHNTVNTSTHINRTQ
jgi:hypothetical protein